MARAGLKTGSPLNELSPATEVRSIFSGIHRGFSTAICWSPMFGNMALLLAIYPGLDWLDVLPLGLVSALVLTLVGYGLNRMHTPPSRDSSEFECNAGATNTTNVLYSIIPVVGALFVFFGLVLVLRQLLSTSVPVAIIILAPITALTWASLEKFSAMPTTSITVVAHDAFQRFPSMASEAALFMSAGFASAVLASALPPTVVAAIAGSVQGNIAGGSLMLMSTIILLAFCGVHPVLTSLLLANTLTPLAMGIPTLVHFSAIITGWGIATAASPFTILSFIISRSANTTPFEVSLIWNGAYSIVGVLAMALILSGLAAVGAL
jgi:hypothetical protein